VIPIVSQDVLEKRRSLASPGIGMPHRQHSAQWFSTRDTAIQFKLSSRCTRGLRSSGMLCCVGRHLVTDVSVRSIGPLLSNLVHYTHALFYVVPKRRLQTDDLHSATSQRNADLKCTVAEACYLGYLHPVRRHETV
jgi:hypothetical protein